MAAAPEVAEILEAETGVSRNCLRLKAWPRPINALQSHKNCKNLQITGQKVLTRPKNVVTIAGFASKKVKLSTQTKALRVVRSVDDGSKTDLGVFGIQASSAKQLA